MSDDIEALRTLVAEELGHKRGDITDAAAFADDLGADTFDMLQLMMSIEDQFGIEIGDDEIAAIATFADLAALVLRKFRPERNAA